MSKTIIFMDEVCTIRMTQYNVNTRKCIVLDDKEGIMFAIASTNLPDVPMEDDEIAIKDYSENSGMLDALIKGEIVAQPHRFTDSGFVTIPICRLLI